MRNGYRSRQRSTHTRNEPTEDWRTRWASEEEETKSDPPEEKKRERERQKRKKHNKQVNKSKRWKVGWRPDGEILPGAYPGVRWSVNGEDKQEIMIFEDEEKEDQRFDSRLYGRKRKSGLPTNREKRQRRKYDQEVKNTEETLREHAANNGGFSALTPVWEDMGIILFLWMVGVLLLVRRMGGEVESEEVEELEASTHAQEVVPATQALTYPSERLVHALRTVVKQKRRKRGPYKKGPRAMKKPEVNMKFDARFHLEAKAAGRVKATYRDESEPYIIAGHHIMERVQELIADGKETTVIVPCKTNSSYMLELADHSVKAPRLLPTGAIKMEGNAPPWFKPSIWVAVRINKEGSTEFKAKVVEYMRTPTALRTDLVEHVAVELLDDAEKVKFKPKAQQLSKLYSAIINSDAETGTFSSRSIPWEEENDNGDIYVPSSAEIAARMETKQGPKPIQESRASTACKVGAEGKHRETVLTLLLKYAELTKPVVPGKVTSIYHHIELNKIDRPIAIRGYHINEADKAWLIVEAEKLCKLGMLQKSSSEWRAMATAAPKKNAEGELKDRRFCVNYRALNKRTIKDGYPMPNLNECLRMRDARVFTKIDLRSGFWQVLLAERDRHLTAFMVGDQIFEWRVMPMGLKNSPMTFQRLIDEVLKGIKGQYCYGYIDDIVIFSKTMEEHLVHVEEILKRLAKFGLRINDAKCEFAMSSVKYLGHIVAHNTIGVDPDKIRSVSEIPYPEGSQEERVKKVQSFLGLTGFYRRFIKGYANLAHSLTELTKNDVKWKFGDTEKRAWDILKKKVCEEPILCQPDMNREFILECDASKFGLGAVLQQIGADGKLHPISFISRKLSPTERRYAVREKEALAILWAITKLREFLSGRQFRVRTDHKSLTWMTKMEDDRTRLGRWAHELAQFDFDICYKKGVDNKVADAMSRMPFSEKNEVLWVGQGIRQPIFITRAPNSAFKVYAAETRSNAKKKAEKEVKDKAERTANKLAADLERKKARNQEEVKERKGDADEKKGNAPKEAKGSEPQAPNASGLDHKHATVVEDKKAHGEAMALVRQEEREKKEEELKRREASRDKEEVEEVKMDAKMRSPKVRDGSLDTEKDVEPVEDEFTHEDTWTQEYRVDPQWRNLYLYLKGETQLEELEAKKRERLLRQVGYYEVKEEKLFFKHRQKPTESESLLLVVPYKWRGKILNRYHDHALAGHRGVKPMTAMITRGYYWPGLRRDVRRHVATCRGCRLAKAPWRPKMGLRGDFGIELGKLEHLHVDHVGPLSRTQNGNSYIFTMIDRCSGWFDCVAVHDKTMQLAADTIFKRWICQRGAPSVLTADNAFRADIIAELGKKCGFQPSITASYHPESNGKIERVHRDLKAYLKIWTEKGEDWEDVLPGFIFAHNNTPKDGERYSPAFLMFGREMRIPGEIVSEGFRLREQETEVDEMLNDMKVAFALAYAARKRRADKDRARLDQRFEAVSFEVGDLVYLYRPKGPKDVSGKLWMGWAGPYRVLAKRSSGFTYEVQKPNGKGKKLIAHVANMISLLDTDRAPIKPVELVEEEKELGGAEESEEEQEVGLELEQDIGEVKGGKKGKEKKGSKGAQRRRTVNLFNYRPLKMRKGKI